MPLATLNADLGLIRNTLVGFKFVFEYNAGSDRC